VIDSRVSNSLFQLINGIRQAYDLGPLLQFFLTNLYLPTKNKMTPTCQRGCESKRYGHPAASFLSADQAVDLSDIENILEAVPNNFADKLYQHSKSNSNAGEDDSWPLMQDLAFALENSAFGLSRLMGLNPSMGADSVVVQK
jgi:hypothetical protein